MITSTASCLVIRHLPTSTLRKPRSTNVPRLSGSAGQGQAGEPVEQRGQRLGELHPGQRRAEAEVDADPERHVRVGVAVRRRTRRAPSKTAGSRLAEPSSAAIFSPGLDGHAADLARPRWRCARTAGARSRSAASPRPRPRTSGPGRSPRRSIAARPLPKTLTDASWPALSSSTTEATISSSESSVVARSLIRSSAGRARRSATSSRTRPAKSPAARHRRRRRPLGTASTSYIRTIACDQSPQIVRVRRGHAEQLGDHQHGQRLGVRPDHVEAGPARPRRAAPRRARAPAAGAARCGRG